MTYFIVIDKPKGWSSHKVVHHIKKITKQKVGHTGTLDPFATGVLPIAVGKATRLIPYLDEHQKIYRATLVLGKKTDSADIDGEVIEEQPIPMFNKDTILNVFANMLGTQMQEVPKYSAVKVDGKRLYKYARQGLDVECPQKEITIYKLHLSSYDDKKIVFEVHCSRGTYVRTIGEDIAQRIGTVGYLSELDRIASGQFTQEQAILDFSMLIADNDSQDLLSTIEENIVAIQSLFPFQTFEVEAEWLPKIANGQRLPLSLLPTLQIDQKLILVHKNKICALGQKEERSLRYLCVLI